ncbi:MAG TPA: hypothetical protein PKL49_09285 [Steroidobacteraceae bacterium]|jgi:hypothetical protein|nr:hypothetical protein [Steroidobacteraceae bacterium]HNS26532.1 hypothetical protein [Steroidobacteraceae bacterium]
MTSRSALLRPCLPLMLICLAGCVTTAPTDPVVIAQPREITTTEVLAEAGDGADRDSVARYRPTEITTGEVQAISAGDIAPPLDFRQRLDRAHDVLYTRFQRLVEATDRRYARPDKELKPVPAAPFRIGVTGELLGRNDKTEASLDLDLDVSLRLPNLEDRLRIFVTSVELDESPEVAGEDSNLRAGLRYQLLKYVSFDIGAKADLPPVAFMAVKWSREYHLGRWDFYPFAKLFAETDESVGYAAAATFDRWSGRRLLRSSTYAKWRNDRDETEWSQSLVFALAEQLIVPDRYGSYLRARDIGKGVALHLLASGLDAHGVDYYETGLLIKRPTGNPWLHWFVEPLVRWDRRYDWDADPGIRIGLDALFWDLARWGRAP